jgi:hypothetical protein
LRFGNPVLVHESVAEADMPMSLNGIVSDSDNSVASHRFR